MCGDGRLHRLPKADPVQVLSSLPPEPPSQPAAVTFGNFDGVHLGHRALLAEVRRAADRLGGPACVVTFDPHPLQLLRPAQAPLAVDSLEGRLQQLAAAGVDLTVVLAFDATLAARTAQWFAGDALLQGLHARAIVVGPDTRYGLGGAGDLQLLQRLGHGLGAEIVACPPTLHRGEVVSSSRVRSAIAAGDVLLAAALLGRPWSLHGAVVQGDQRGRTIGFATANIDAHLQQQPAAGVYATRLYLPDGSALDAVSHCGTRPTFSGVRWQVEAHVLDWHGDLYGQTVRLQFLERLRGEQRFDGLEALRTQIGRDIAAARAVFAADRGAVA
jgi:riboflavin kinase/FMN adenylyltransferase